MENTLPQMLARLGMSQSELSDMLGVHQKTVERWINGRQRVPTYVSTCLWLLERLSLAEMELEIGSDKQTRH